MLSKSRSRITSRSRYSKSSSCCSQSVLVSDSESDSSSCVEFFDADGSTPRHVKTNGVAADVANTTDVVKADRKSRIASALEQRLCSSCSRKQLCLGAAVDSSPIFSGRSFSGSLPAFAGLHVINLDHFLHVLKDATKSSLANPESLSLSSAICAGDLKSFIWHITNDQQALLRKCHVRPLLEAASSPSPEILVLLLYLKGDDINIYDEARCTPLFLAVKSQRLTNIQILLQCGADITTMDASGCNLVIFAVQHSSIQILEYILRHFKVDVNHQDVGGWTALMWCMELPERVEHAQLLLEYGANIHLVDEENNTVLHWASYYGCTDLITDLLDKGAEMDVQNEYGETALHIAAKMDNLPVAHVLLLRGANSSVLNIWQKTPDEIAASQAVALLLRSHANLLNLVGKAKTTHRIVDITKGSENMPIYAVNEVDSEEFPSFVYVKSQMESEGASINRNLALLKGCSCESNCIGSGCSCRSRSDGGRLWIHGDSFWVDGLSDWDRPVIFECGPQCACSARCSNRLVQKGIKYPLEVFKTTTKGWAVRSLSSIPRGAFIAEYSGELISDEAANSRTEDSYLFDLDMKETGDHLYCYDALRYGNIARFFNHLCEPNMVPVRVFYDHGDLRYPHMAFFSIRTIEPMEELGFDYGYSYWEVKRILCACNSKHCRYVSSR